jgi:RimJ/RimL family protein N-acetyltransferase
MGVARSHRREGGGTLLLATAIEWARDQPMIDWIDLGVFSGNPGAKALYAGHGFMVLGRTIDRFRVDGKSLDEISMTLSVARAAC